MNRSPFQQVNATALTLTSSLAVVPAQTAIGGDPTTGAIPLGNLAFLSATFDYSRNAGSTTGRPSVVVELSRDPASTAAASVSHWVGVQVLDGGSFSAGQVDAYPYQVNFRPSAAGASSWMWPGAIDVRGFSWVRFRALDQDGATPGTLVAFVGGTI